jgi:hypothetical protein
LARTAILCTPDGDEGKTVTRHLYLAKYIWYEFCKQLSSISTRSLVHRLTTDK